MDFNPKEQLEQLQVSFVEAIQQNFTAGIFIAHLYHCSPFQSALRKDAQKGD